MVEFKYSVVIPVYERQENFETFYNSIDKILVNHSDVNFVIIDDGNSYDLNKIINKNRKNLSVINNSINLGYGASIKKGVEYSKSQIIGIIDSDNTYDFDHLIELLKKYEEFNCDLLIGKRVFKFKDNFFKVFFRKIINKLSSKIFNNEIKDINSGFRVFCKNDFEKDKDIYSDKFSLSSTQTLCTISRNKLIKYVDTNYMKRNGNSKINILKDPFRFLYLIFKIFLIFSPMKFFGKIGIFFIIISFIVLFLSIIFLENILDLTFLILFISGINFIFFGLIAEIIKINGNKNI
tara:strand:- start:476 stop:1354 length:879 start_codon:yes stop_codon:yes gene_type:complete